MMPAALLVLWAGAPWIVLLVALVGAGMAWEWLQIVGAKTSAAAAVAAATVAALSVLAMGFLAPAVAFAVAFAVMVVGTLAVTLLPDARRVWAWSAGGLIWIVLACLAFVWLRGLPVIGFRLVLWLLILVWAVDIGAYACGRTIGGPRLAPLVSPNKTWAGLAGGVVSAVVAGTLVTAILGFHDRMLYALASGGLAVIEQMGDLMESYAKRRFGVKDSGTLIPGHGGLLDRLDGAIAVASAVALAELLGVNWQ